MKILILLMLVSTPVWASSQKCMWLNSPVKSNFEHTIKIERIKQDIRRENKKFNFDRVSEKQLFEIANKMYCEDSK